MAEMSRQQARRWVQEWWQEQMRNPTAPDFPDAHEDILMEVWAEESQRIANRVGPTYRKVTTARKATP